MPAAVRASAGSTGCSVPGSARSPPATGTTPAGWGARRPRSTWPTRRSPRCPRWPAPSLIREASTDGPDLQVRRWDLDRRDHPGPLQRDDRRHGPGQGLLHRGPARLRRKRPAGDVIVGGRNFGCGSSREHAPMAIKAAGIQAVVARSFARIFYRNAINIGLPVIQCDAIYDAVEDGDPISLDNHSGSIDGDGKMFQGETT